MSYIVLPRKFSNSANTRHNKWGDLLGVVDSGNGTIKSTSIITENGIAGPARVQCRKSPASILDYTGVLVFNRPKVDVDPGYPAISSLCAYWVSASDCGGVQIKLEKTNGLFILHMNNGTSSRQVQTWAELLAQPAFNKAVLVWRYNYSTQLLDYKLSALKPYSITPISATGLSLQRFVAKSVRTINTNSVISSGGFGGAFTAYLSRRVTDAEVDDLLENPYILSGNTEYKRKIYSLPSVNHWELQLKIGEAGEWTDVPNQPEDTQNFIKDSGLTNGDVYYARLRKFTNGVPSDWEISDPVTFTSESVSDERSVYAFWSSVPFIGISGVKEAFGVASLLSTPAVMAPGKKEAKGVTFLSASSTFLAIGKKEGKGTASLSSTLAIMAFGKKEGKGPLLVSSSSVLTAVGKKEAKGPLTISFNAGQFIGLGKKEAKSQVFLSSTPAVGAFGIKEAKGPAYIVSSVVFGFDGIKAYVGLDKDGPGIFSASSVIGFGGRKESAGPLTIAQNNAIIADHLKEAFGPAYLSGNLEFYGMREEQVVPISLEEVLQVVKSSSRNKTAVSSVRKKSVLSTVRLKQVKSLKRT